MSNQLEVISNLIYGQEKSFMSALSDKSINFSAEAGFALQVLHDSPYLAKTALANQASLVAAVTNIAAIGISLNPASKQAYLVPRKGKVCLDISYIGMMHLAQSTGAILWGQAVIVRESDTFELQGIDIAPEHKYSPFSKNRGEIVGSDMTKEDYENIIGTQLKVINDLDDIELKTKKGPPVKGSTITKVEEVAIETVDGIINEQHLLQETELFLKTLQNEKANN